MDVADDPELRASLLAARAWGVSPSRFYGRPAVSVTRYEYDDAGRLVAAVTEHDPDWSGEDRDLAWALQAWETSLCPACGASLAETTAPAAEDGYVTEALLCHRCVAVGQEHARYRDHQSSQAIVVSARPRASEPEVSAVEDGGLV